MPESHWINRYLTKDADVEAQIKDCPTCKASAGRDDSSSLLDHNTSDPLFDTFSVLLQLLQSLKTRQARVPAMIALRSLLLHSPNASGHDVMKSAYGQWCLQALRAPARDLRIAAGSVLR